MSFKKIDFGEYVVTIEYIKETGDLDIVVYDEGGDIIDMLKISIDEDDDEETAGLDDNTKPNLN